MRRSRFILVLAGILVLALGGTATATRLITGRQIKDGSIAGKDIKSHSIKLKDIGFYNGDGVGPAKVVKSEELTLPPGKSSFDVDPKHFQATCPNGLVAAGTGFDASIGHASFVQAYGSFVGGFIYNDTDIPIKVSVQAICGYGSDATALATTAKTGQTDYARDLARAASIRPHVTASAAKSCSSSYTRARIDGQVKCLRVGEYCAHRYDHRSPRRYAYKHYGFACRKRDSRGAYHLTYR